jgi:hypothetical protein
MEQHTVSSVSCPIHAGIFPFSPLFGKLMCITRPLLFTRTPAHAESGLSVHHPLLIRLDLQERRAREWVSTDTLIQRIWLIQLICIDRTNVAGQR